MKYHAMAVIAAFGVWIAGSASVESAASGKFAEFSGPGADRHPSLVQQHPMRFAGVATDRHPAAMPQHPMRFAGVAVDRHPAAMPQHPMRFAGVAADRHPYVAQRQATRIAGPVGPVPIEAILRIGTEENDLALAPRTLRLDKGGLYRLVLINAGKVAHRIAAPELGTLVDSMRLTRGVELKPGERQVWYFAADRAGVYPIGCVTKAHAKAGMTGRIIVG